MAQLQLVKSTGNILIPATPETSDFLQSKVKLGSVLEADFRQVRNPVFHRRFFSLLNLGYEYWTPTGRAITPVERKLVSEFARYLATFGGCYESLQAAADEFLNRVAHRRAESITAAKSFDVFREWATVEAGYFNLYQMPNGALYKKAKSISFAKMDDTEFYGLYKSVMDVLWNYVLHRTFPSQQAAENAAVQLLGFAA